MRTTALAVLIAASLPIAAAAASWEEPKTFKAREILTPEQRKGEHHAVDDEVPTEGFYYAFTLQTDFGELKPVGLGLLRKRIQETEALAALREVSKTGVFLEAAGRSLESLGRGVATVAKDPEATAKGIGRGLKRFGVNLGRKTKRLVEDATDDDEGKEEKSAGEKTENVANSVLGVNKSARLWAQKLQVDPYSRNPVLQKALIEIAKIDAAGGIATKVVVPIPTVVSTTSTVGGLVWGKDPEALRKSNEAGLRALGVSEEVAAGFFRNDAFTLTDQTRFVVALTAVKAKGLADYVDAARGAKTPREGLFFVESAEMLQRQHGEGAVSAVLTDSRAMIALSGRRAVALLPVDYLSWTEPVAQAATEIVARAREELGATGLRMQLTGQVSAQARKELEALGWALTEKAPGGVAGAR
ncbi:MAG: hypothetical protein PVJ73_06945 [Acidobacteriota bacterium]|jgi:hypothetical protein